MSLVSWVITVFVIWVILWWVGRKFLRIGRALFLMSAVVTIIAIIFTVLVVLDFRKLSERFQNSEQIILLVHEEQIKVAMRQTPTETIVIPSAEVTLPYDPGDDFVLLFHSAILVEIPSMAVSVNDVLYGKEGVIQLLTNDTYAAEQVRTVQAQDTDHLRAFVLSTVLNEHVIGQNNTQFTIRALKKRQFELLPTTLTFRLLRWVPLSLIEKQKR